MRFKEKGKSGLGLNQGPLAWAASSQSLRIEPRTPGLGCQWSVMLILSNF